VPLPVQMQDFPLDINVNKCYNKNIL